MASWYKLVAKPLLFMLDPELAHSLSASAILYGAKTPFINKFLRHQFSLPGDQSQSLHLAGLKLLNPVGLAAGFDKNAQLINVLPVLGFGFAEIGTVTPLPQIGNPKPRLFRLPKDQAIINRMGFNNDGMKIIAGRLAKRNQPDFIIGGNIGKNKDTPNEKAHEDYLACFKCLQPFVDYFTINLSSPNTQGLRLLLEKKSLTQILEVIQNENQKMAKAKPVFLKISPDMEDGQLEDIVQICKSLKLSGIVAANTSITRNGLSLSPSEITAIGAGGLSGKPLNERSSNVISKLKSLTGNDLLIIGSGGIMNPKDATSKFKAGADAIQLYSGLVYEGPGLVKDILKELKKEII